MIPNDPLADLFPSQHPAVFDALPDDERQWRFRLYLATWAIGGTEEFSWAIALGNHPVHVMESQEILAGITDEALREAVSARAELDVLRTSGGRTNPAARYRPPDQRQTHSPRTPSLLPTPTTSAPAPSPRTETSEEFFHRLLAESRAQPKPPSRVTLLVPPMRTPAEQ